MAPIKINKALFLIQVYGNFEHTKNAMIPSTRLIACLSAVASKLELFCARRPSEAERNIIKPPTVSSDTEIRKKRSLFFVCAPITLLL